MANRRVRSNVIVAVGFAAVLTLATATARAGLQSAILALYDSYDALDTPREFLAPFAGNDAPGIPFFGTTPGDETQAKFVAGPKLTYNSLTGNLTAIIPAAVLNVASADLLVSSGLPAVVVYPTADLTTPPNPQYQKLYSIASLSIDTHLLNGESNLPNSNTFVWGAAGPLEEAAANSEIVTNDEQVIWRTTPTISSGGFTGLVVNYKVTAAVVDIGPALPPGLTPSALQQIGFVSSPLNYVDYFNHRGVVSLHVPIMFEVVPEPSTLAELQIAAATAILMATARRRARTRESRAFDCVQHERKRAIAWDMASIFNK